MSVIKITIFAFLKKKIKQIKKSNSHVQLFYKHFLVSICLVAVNRPARLRRLSIGYKRVT